LECDPAGKSGLQPPPQTLRSEQPLADWPLSLEDAIRIALANNEVIQDIGGRVISAPATASTVYDVALQETDPRFGQEAALRTSTPSCHEHGLPAR
jgi:hypothetical protein